MTDNPNPVAQRLRDHIHILRITGQQTAAQAKELLGYADEISHLASRLAAVERERDEAQKLLDLCLPFIRDAGDDEDPDAKRAACDLVDKISDFILRHAARQRQGREGK